MNQTQPLLELLRALAAGRCPADLWQRGAVAHCGCPAAEAARVALVRAALEAGEWGYEWQWPDVPPPLAARARALLPLAREWSR